MTFNANSLIFEKTSLTSTDLDKYGPKELKEWSRRQYYDNHIDKVIECECGAKIKFYCQNAHRKTKKHQRYLQANQ